MVIGQVCGKKRPQPLVQPGCQAWIIKHQPVVVAVGRRIVRLGDLDASRFGSVNECLAVAGRHGVWDDKAGGIGGKVDWLAEHGQRSPWLKLPSV